MSENGAMEQFNINELAGATGLILGAFSGILVVIFKSRCYCKFRVGISDKFNICMCERKPPPDIPTSDEEQGKVIPTNSVKPKAEDNKVKPNIISREQLIPDDSPPNPEIIIEDIILSDNQVKPNLVNGKKNNDP